MKKLIGIVALFILAAGLPAAQTIVVTAPNGGETLTIGQTMHITWTASNVSQNVKLQLIRSGGALVGVIANNVAPAPGTFAWTIGQYIGGTAAAGSYKVRVRTMDNAVEDASNADFTIAGGTVTPPQGTLSLTAPNGGESWSQGAATTISWTGANLSGSNRLELWKGNARIGVIKNNLPAATGSFPWQAGVSAAGMAAEGTDYKVKVINSSGLEDAGDNFFAISKGMYQTSMNQTLGNVQPQRVPQGIHPAGPDTSRPASAMFTTCTVNGISEQASQGAEINLSAAAPVVIQARATSAVQPVEYYYVFYLRKPPTYVLTIIYEKNWSTQSDCTFTVSDSAIRNKFYPNGMAGMQLPFIAYGYIDVKVRNSTQSENPQNKQFNIKWNFGL